MFTELHSVTCNGIHSHFKGTREVTTSENGISVGDTVTYAAFTDSKGKYHPAIHGLKVESITVHSERYGTHERIRATGGGFRYDEGNAKFFEVR